MQQKAKSVQHFAALASLLAGVCGLLATPAVAQQATGSTTDITAQLCAGGERAPSGVIASPSPDSTVGNPDQTLSVITSWVTSYEVHEGDNLLVTVSPAQYAENVTSTANITLSQGANNLHLVVHGGCPTTTSYTESMRLTYSRTAATVKQLETRQSSPQLTGFISHTQASVAVSINKKTYTAQNNGDGTWVLPGGVISPGLKDGTYSVRVTAVYEGETVSDTFTRGAVTIDTTAPIVELTTTKSSSRSPSLSGNIDDPLASLNVSINKNTYTAQNNGDGTWVLPGGMIDALASGTYEVTITAIDRAGNSRTTVHSVEIQASNEIGFLLSPNTGFARIQSLNIPSYLLYGSVTTLVAACALLLLARRRSRLNKQ